MNGELNYDDILHFPNEIVVEEINNFYLVIAVQTANWIVLYNARQIDFLNMLRSGKCIGNVIETVDSEQAMVDLKIVLAAIFARKFAGVNGEVTKEYLEGYKMLNIYIRVRASLNSLIRENRVFSKFCLKNSRPCFLFCMMVINVAIAITPVATEPIAVHRRALLNIQQRNIYLYFDKI